MAGACLLLRAACTASASSWLWGLDTLRDWPAPWPVVLSALAALAFVPAVARRAARPLAWLGDALGGAGLPARALVAVAVAAALVLLRDPLRFTGDSGTRLALIVGGVDMRPLMPQLAPLDLVANVAAARGLTALGIAPATAMQWVGALEGAALTLALLAFLRACGARGAAWTAAAVLLLAGGSLVHLAGYGKYGPLLVGMAIAATGLVRLAREERGAGTFGAGVAIALLAHRSAYALLPAALWALAAAWRRAPQARRRGVALAGAIVLAVALALAPRAIGLLAGYDVGANLVGAAAHRHVQPARQVVNALNALFLLSPLWPLGLVAAWRSRRPRGSEAPAAFPLGGVAALALAGELAVMLATRPSQGPMRDWDTQVAAALAVSLATAGGLVALARHGRVERAALPIAATALAAGIALWGIQVDTTIGERRVGTLLRDPAAWTPEEWSRAHEFIAQREFQAGRYAEAARDYAIVVAASPSPRMVDNLAVALGMAGRVEESRRALARAMTLPQRSATTWVELGRLALMLGDTARANVCVDSIRVHQRLESGGGVPGVPPPRPPSP